MGLPDYLINDGVGQTPATATATTAASELVAANSNRRWLRLYNSGAATVFIAASTTAQLNKGMFIASSGTLTFDANFMARDAISGITASTSATIIYQEGTIT